MHIPSRFARSMFRPHFQPRPRPQATARAPRLYSRSKGAGTPLNGAAEPSAQPRIEPVAALRPPRFKALHLPNIVFQQGGSATQAAMLLLPP